MEKITILITDDHTMVRETLSVLLNSDPRFNVIALAKTGEEAIELTKQFKPDIVLMDINLPGINGIVATQAIRKITSTTKIIGLSMQTLPSFVYQMIQHGAGGYVTKNSSFPEMCKAIIEVHNGRRYICDEIKDIIANNTLSGNDNETQFASVSEREIEIIEFVRKGFSSREIADCLKLSIKTIDAHRYNVMKRLKLKNVAALVNYFNNSHSVIHA
jgi:DNA-binding NarL/FixJ family response regulator